MSKNKRLLILLFAILFLSDICHYIKAFIKLGVFRIDRISLFVGNIGGRSILHISIIFFLVCVVIYFFANFFKRDDF